MPNRLRAGAVLTFVLASLVTPTAAACLRHDAAAAPMSCCKREAPCGKPALQRACCACSPQVPSIPPDGASLVPPSTAVVFAPAGPLLAHAHPGPIGLDVQGAFAATMRVAVHGPPWLLNASLLI